MGNNKIVLLKPPILEGELAQAIDYQLDKIINHIELIKLFESQQEN
jgi:hypothetical protein